jgi:hypothetical protein
MDKFLEHLHEAKNSLHLADITFKVIKDKKILLKILLETKSSLLSSINAILQYEYIYKRIDLYKSSKENLRTFARKCAPAYKISPEEIRTIFEILELADNHKNSSMEILKDDKIIILLDNLRAEVFNLEKAKKFISTAKNILLKAKAKFELNIKSP